MRRTPIEAGEVTTRGGDANQVTGSTIPEPAPGPAGRGVPLLRLRGVSRVYGQRRALHPLDLDVPAGSCVALFGHNGSGKSTLLRIASGRDAPTRGKALFDGRPIDEDDPAVRARVAVAGDTVACYPDLTVREHLQLVTTAHAVDDADAWIDHVLADRRLSGHADALPGSLSSGQLQSLLLAAALVRPRDLLVLDEPEQRLDPEARVRLAELLRAERDSGVAVLLATHQADLAEAVADRLVALEDGRVIDSGPPAEVLRRLGARS
jgi:ABC-type multidrug transport system ATPase subunit